MDRSSPSLARALANNETLSEVRIRFFRTDPNGQETGYYTIRLNNARIIDISMVWDSPLQPTAQGSGQLREVVSFAYQSVTTVWDQDGNSTTINRSTAP